MANKSKAFSLAELLVVLLTVGVISSFTIPKVLTSYDNKVKQSVFKQTFSNLSHLLQGDAPPENLDTTPKLLSWLESKVNAVKFCPNNVTTEGCMAKASYVESSPYWANLPGYVTHEGVLVMLTTDSYPWNGLETLMGYKYSAVWSAWNPTPTTVTNSNAGSMRTGGQWAGPNNAWLITDFGNVF